MKQFLKVLGLCIVLILSNFYGCNFNSSNKLGENQPSGLGPSPLASAEQISSTIFLTAEPGPMQSFLNGNSANTISQGGTWKFTMGYHFRPVKDVVLTQIGGIFVGNKLVRLWDESGKELIRSSINGNGGWTYANVPQITLNAGKRYTVAVTLDGSGGSSARLATASRLPFTNNGVVIESVTYVSGSARPTNSFGTSFSVVYGIPDIKLQDAGSPDPIIPIDPIDDEVDGIVTLGSEPLKSYVSNNAVTLTKNQNWNYTMGYHFLPNQNVELNKVGGLFNGKKQVRVWDQAGTVIVDAQVEGNNNDWKYVSVNPVTLKKGNQYTVAVTLNSSGGIYFRSSPSTSLYPINTGLVTISSTTYINGSQRPISKITNSLMYGLADIRVIPTSDTVPDADFKYYGWYSHFYSSINQITNMPSHMNFINIDSQDPNAIQMLSQAKAKNFANIMYAMKPVKKQILDKLAGAPTTNQNMLAAFEEIVRSEAARIGNLMSAITIVYVADEPALNRELFCPQDCTCQSPGSNIFPQYVAIVQKYFGTNKKYAGAFAEVQVQGTCRGPNIPIPQSVNMILFNPFMQSSDNPDCKKAEQYVESHPNSSLRWVRQQYNGRDVILVGDAFLKAQGGNGLIAKDYKNSKCYADKLYQIAKKNRPLVDGIIWFIYNKRYSTSEPLFFGANPTDLNSYQRGLTNITEHQSFFSYMNKPQTVLSGNNRLYGLLMVRSNPDGILLGGYSPQYCSEPFNCGESMPDCPEGFERIGLGLRPQNDGSNYQIYSCARTGNSQISEKNRLEGIAYLKASRDGGIIDTNPTVCTSPFSCNGGLPECPSGYLRKGIGMRIDTSGNNFQVYSCINQQNYPKNSNQDVLTGYAYLLADSNNGGIINGTPVICNIPFDCLKDLPPCTVGNRYGTGLRPEGPSVAYQVYTCTSAPRYR